MSYYAINDFDGVKKNYEETPVLVSKYHTANQDIRPIANRSRKWERTIKVSDNSYALADGNYTDIFNRHNMTDEFIHDMCPILWERREDGDYVRIRNVNRHHTVHGRLRFLSWFLPRGLEATARNGRLFVISKWDGVEHYLPKTTMQWDYSNKVLEVGDDGMFLWFKHTGDKKFERANVIEAASTRIDIARKKRLKPYAKEFFDWACIMRNMIKSDWQSRKAYQEQLEQWAKDNKVTEGNTVFFGFSCVKPKAIEEIMVRPDHPMRVHLAVDMMMETKIINPYTEKVEEITSQNQISLIKERFNRWYTKRLNIYKLEKF